MPRCQAGYVEMATLRYAIPCRYDGYDAIAARSASGRCVKSLGSAAKYIARADMRHAAQPLCARRVALFVARRAN